MSLRFSSLASAAALLFALFSNPSASVAVQSNIKAEAGRKPVTVTSDTMEASTVGNRVVFRGNVAAVEDFTICSDELNILYDGNRDVSEIEASGNVRIFQDQKKSTAGKAVYNRKERLIVLTGEPQVTQCSDVIKGDKITVYIDDNNAVVESGAGKRVRAVIMPEKKCPGLEGRERTSGEETLCNGAR